MWGLLALGSVLDYIMQQTSTSARTIEEFLHQKKVGIGNIEEIQQKLEDRRDRYIAEVNTLFDQITKWLDKLKKDGPVDYRRKQTSNFEEGIGEYSVSSLEVFIADRMIVFLPVGTKIFGALGRVDIMGNYEEAHLVMPEWGKWQFARIDYIPGGGAKPFFTDFTEEEFKNALLSLVAE